MSFSSPSEHKNSCLSRVIKSITDLCIDISKLLQAYFFTFSLFQVSLLPPIISKRNSQLVKSQGFSFVLVKTLLCGSSPLKNNPKIYETINDVKTLSQWDSSTSNERSGNISSYRREIVQTVRHFLSLSFGNRSLILFKLPPLTVVSGYSHCIVSIVEVSTKEQK